MNLNAYDSISSKINRTLTWVDVAKHQLLSREIVYRPYSTIGKRYVKEDNYWEYYLILLDDYPTDRSFTKTKKDDYGRIKINLNSIWNESSFASLRRDVNVSISHVEHTDDGDIYKINL